MENLATLLTDGVNGASIISIDTLTDVPLRGGQANPHLGRVQKRVKGSNVMVFSNKKINGYDAMVRRRLEQEGKDPNSFVLSPRSWGRRLTGAPFVEHNGNFYVEVIFLRSGEVEYLLDGEVISRNDVIGLTEKHKHVKVV